MVLDAGPLAFFLSLEGREMGSRGRIGIEESLAGGGHIVDGLWLLLSCPSRDALAQGRAEHSPWW